MKYLVGIDYDGTRYRGWQVQPDTPTIQGILEKAISTLLRTPTSVVGCGRTDAGVHARNYPFHMEAAAIDEVDDFIYHLNAILPDDISVRYMRDTGAAFHARFDALARSYVYYLHGYKDPFRRKYSWYFPRYNQLDLSCMEQATKILQEYDQFFPFCKTGHDSKTYMCAIKESRLNNDVGTSTLSFHISANRFLRGMVRMIMGMLIQVGLQQLSVEEVREAMERQCRLPKPLSAPAHGLFFTGAVYPN